MPQKHLTSYVNAPLHSFWFESRLKEKIIEKAIKELQGSKATLFVEIDLKKFIRKYV